MPAILNDDSVSRSYSRLIQVKPRVLNPTSQAIVHSYHHILSSIIIIVSHFMLNDVRSWKVTVK